jgi:hypothetical protein
MYPVITTHTTIKLAIMNASSIPGRTIPNLLADKYGHLNALSTVAVCSGVLAFVMFAIKNVASVIIFAMLYGFFSGACESQFLGPRHFY